MINMGYCRFENTYRALLECIDALIDEDSISESENKYRLSLYEACKEYIAACDDYVYTEESDDDF